MADVQEDVFVMRGARYAAANGMSHIEAQIKALEAAVIKNPGLAFDLAKFIVESTCKTILSERKVAFGKGENLPNLFKAVTNNLPILPTGASAESDARKKLVQTLNGLHTALQGICQLRNAYGFASHGADSERPQMETAQAILAAQAADAIVGFLFNAHRAEREASGRKQGGQNPTVDAVLDVAYEPVTIAGQPYSVSEALYATDREAYLAIAALIRESRNALGELLSRYPASVKPEVKEVSFVHYEDVAYLKTVNDKGQVTLENTSFISSGRDDLLFLPSTSPDDNATLLVREFDPYSLINCFDLLTADACAKIASAYDDGTLGSIFPPPAVTEQST